MGPIEADIDAQIEFLQLPTTRWVHRYPRYVDEACAVVRVGEYGISKLTEDTTRFLDDFIITCGETVLHFFEEKKFFSSITYFNDCQYRGEPVIQMLEKARAKAAEEGL